MSWTETSGHAPAFVPSFSYLTDKGREDYRIEKAIDVMKSAYGRRSKPWPAEEEALVKYAKMAAREAEA